MKLCDDTITVYNAKYDKSADADVYHRTIINGVRWFGTVKSTVDSSGLKAANQVTVRIPTEADTQGKAYADPAAYASAADVLDLFTLNEGDVIVRGVGANGLRPSAIRKVYPETMTILAVTDSSQAPNAPHRKVVGA